MKTTKATDAAEIRDLIEESSGILAYHFPEMRIFDVLPSMHSRRIGAYQKI
jgi:hypothetical protein